MAGFWDARARDDAMFYIDNRRTYGRHETDVFWSRGEDDLERLLGALDVSIGSSDVVLDLGCGVGRLTRALAHRAATVHGLDVSAEMLELARDHNGDLPNVHWLLGDGTSLSAVADASVDVVISHVVFQHIPEPRITLGYITEIGRVLRPGGWTAFGISNDPAAHRPPTAVTRTRRRLAELARRRPPGQLDPEWIGSALDLGEVQVAALDGGLEIERVAGAGTQYCAVLARRT